MATIQNVIDKLNEVKNLNEVSNPDPDLVLSLERICQLCLILIDQFLSVPVIRLQQDDFGVTPGTTAAGPPQCDPEHGEIFDPEHGEIFDPQERFYPGDGIPLRAIAEGLYDSYGNRISPKDSTAVLMSLLAWIMKWEQFKEKYPEYFEET